jgi:hypothetical protein
MRLEGDLQECGGRRTHANVKDAGRLCRGFYVNMLIRRAPSTAAPKSAPRHTVKVPLEVSI